MITVEDLIDRLSRLNSSMQIIDQRIVASFLKQLQQGNNLTEKQGNLAVKIIKKYHKILTAQTGVNILNFILNPQYKNPFRQSTYSKKISMFNKAVEGIVGKTIKVEFPYDDRLIGLIRTKKPDLGASFWSKDHRAWIFSLCEQNLQFLNYLIVTENFEADEEFSQYSQQIREIVEDMDNRVPMLTINNGVLEYKNASPYVPQLESKEIIPALFEARRRAITTWDENVGGFLETYNNNTTVNFLKTEISEFFHVDSNTFDIFELRDIVLNLKPCVFIIPGGSELEKLKIAYNFLSTIGILEKNISVMFRLSAENGKNFNNFVKDMCLNNPIEKNTEIVFISTKVPKPLMKTNMYFNSVINMGFENPHYTSKNFVEKHPNVIYYSEKPVQPNFLWQLLES